jgi:hypothetical protein
MGKVTDYKKFFDEAYMLYTKIKNKTTKTKHSTPLAMLYQFSLLLFNFHQILEMSQLSGELVHMLINKSCVTSNTLHLKSNWKFFI